MQSRLPGFYKHSVDERLAIFADQAALDADDVARLRGASPRALEAASRMIENVVGVFQLPVGIATNFRIDGQDVLIPMVIEEPSVVAAASNAARMLRSGPGVVTSATADVMIGQVELLGIEDPERATEAIQRATPSLIDQANLGQPRLLKRGGGMRAIEVRSVGQGRLVVHLLVDVCDAMGANLVNQMALAPALGEIAGGQVGLRILSNLAAHRRAKATGRVPFDRLARPDLGLSGVEVARRVEAASRFAEEDPYRAATHNKGIMNGIDAFLLATGQDWRAMEAGSHAWACRDGRYTAFASWRVLEDEGVLEGSMELPVQLGTVGGVTRVHEVVQVLLRVVGAAKASELSRIAMAVGLAQNLSAILALSTEGIQRGHMSLHARNIATVAGAAPAQVDAIVGEMIRRRDFSHAAAEAILDATASEPRAIDVDAFDQMRSDWWPSVRAAIEVQLPADTDPESVSSMAWYHLNLGGKRVRAILPLLVARVGGDDPTRLVPLAAALELLHAATLIHDEVQSGSRERRGQPCTWVRFGRDRAISTGDAMLLAALSCLDDLDHGSELVRPLRKAVVGAMSEMVHAQVRWRQDTRSEDPFARRLELERVRAGSLVALAFSGPALLAEHLPSRPVLDDAGRELGVLLALQEVLLDLLGSEHPTRASLNYLQEAGAMDVLAAAVASQHERVHRALDGFDTRERTVLEGLASALLQPLRAHLGADFAKRVAA